MHRARTTAPPIPAQTANFQMRGLLKFADGAKLNQGWNNDDREVIRTFIMDSERHILEYLDQTKIDLRMVYGIIRFCGHSSAIKDLNRIWDAISG